MFASVLVFGIAAVAACRSESGAAATGGAGEVEELEIDREAILGEWKQRVGPVRALDCPSNIPRQSGRVDSCTIAFASGETFDLQLRQTAEMVQTALVQADDAALTRTLTDRLSSAATIDEVKCPRRISLKPGTHGTCAVRFANGDRVVVPFQIEGTGFLLGFCLYIPGTSDRLIERALASRGFPAARVDCGPHIRLVEASESCPFVAQDGTRHVVEIAASGGSPQITAVR